MTPWSCISTNKLLFVTKSAQVQAPCPPTLTKVLFKSASEPPAVAALLPLHTPHYTQKMTAPSPSMPEPLNLAKLSSFSPVVVIAADCSWLCLHQFPAGKRFCLLAELFFFLVLFACLVSDSLKAPRDFGKPAQAGTNSLFTEIQL